MAASVVSIVKREGQIVEFSKDKIYNAIKAALRQTNQDQDQATSLTALVLPQIKDGMNVETIQNLVEAVLMQHGPYTTARAYITYRDAHCRMRRKLQAISDRNANGKQQWFKNPYNAVIYYRTYARWINSLQRREHWDETVDRFMRFLSATDNGVFTELEKKEIHHAILTHKVMPSMRLLQFAGPAAHRNNITAFNCCFVGIQELIDIRDIMYVLMCGTGMGFSVERCNINNLPVITPQTGEELDTFVVPDSKEGWCDALYLGLQTWFGGKDVKFDYSLVRPLGARLVTTGGTASGPEPLAALLDFTRNVILSKQGSKLSPINVHDIICHIGQTVVVGSVRRSALISISDLDDVEMRDAKTMENLNLYPYRWQANNSAAYNEVPTDDQFLDEFNQLRVNKTGERGMVNRYAMYHTMPERRRAILGDRWKRLGLNPCGEILLNSYQFCNLTTVPLRSDMTPEDIYEAQRISAMIGTWQSTLTDFKYVSEKFKIVSEEERLLGCSMTGMFDCPAIWNDEVLQRAKKIAVDTNFIFADRFGVNRSTSVTCVKPEGTTSEMLDTSSGIHPRYAPYYMRRVRFSAKDKILALLREQGADIKPENGQTEENATTYVVAFPIKSPDGALCVSDVSVDMHFERWLQVKRNYTEHNPSVSIYVKNNEWLKVMNLVYTNFIDVCGISNFPVSDHAYQQAPFSEITKQEYEQAIATLPALDFSKLPYYEQSDTTDVKREVACAGGACFM